MKNSIIIALLFTALVVSETTAQKADVSLLRGTGFFLDHSEHWNNQQWNTCISTEPAYRRTFAAYVEDTHEAGKTKQAKSKTEGIIIGTDVYRTTTAQVGIFAGYNDGFSVHNTILVGNEGYIGGYGRWIFGNGIDVGGSLAYGTQDYKALFLTALEGEALETSIEIGYRCREENADSYNSLSLRPLIALDYYSNQLTALRGIEISKLNQCFLRTGIEGRWDCTANFALNANVYYSADLTNTNTNEKEFSFPLIMSSSGLQEEFVSYSLGLTWKAFPILTLFGGYQGSADSESVAIGASVGW